MIKLLNYYVVQILDILFMVIYIYFLFLNVFCHDSIKQRFFFVKQYYLFFVLMLLIFASHCKICPPPTMIRVNNISNFTPPPAIPDQQNMNCWYVRVKWLERIYSRPYIISSNVKYFLGIRQNNDFSRG